MPKKLYVVTLTAEERSYLKSLVSKGKTAAYKMLHAQILLKADNSENGPNWKDEQIVESLDVSRPTVERIRKRFVEESLEAALNRRKQKNRKPKIIDGEAEAQLIALACSDPPEGRVRWTLKLLAQEMVEREIVPSVCAETLRTTLKKTTLNRG